MAYKIGIILLSKELREDIWTTLKAMAEIGYQGMEGDLLVAANPATTRDNRKRLNDLGVECVAIPASHFQEDRLPEAIAKAHEMGARFIVDYWAKPATHEEVLKLAEQLERMAKIAKAEGLRVLYHNHEHEFAPIFGEKGNESMFDLLYSNTEDLGFELDIAWCHFGGADPVQVIRRCGRRIPVLHVKDLAENTVRGHFCAVGLGKVPCFAAIEAAAAKGAEWMVVEQDRPRNLSPYESALASILNIREAGLHPSR